MAWLQVAQIQVQGWGQGHVGIPDALHVLVFVVWEYRLLN